MSVEADDERRRAWNAVSAKTHAAVALPGTLPHKERPWPRRDCPYLQSLGRLQDVCVSGPSRRNSCESMSVRQEITKVATADGRLLFRPSRARAAPETSRKWQIVMSESWERNSVPGNSSLVSRTMLHSLSPVHWPCLVALSTCRGWLLPSNDPSGQSRSARGVGCGVCGAPSSEASLNASDRFSPELIHTPFN